MKNSGLNKHAFTFIELLIASAVFITMLAAVYGLYFSGIELRQTTEDKAELESRAKRAVFRMVSELMGATRTSTQNPSPNLSIVSGPNQKIIKFHLPDDKDEDGYLTDEDDGTIEWDTNNPIEYQFIRGLRLLRRLEKGERITIAQDVSDVDFFDITSDSSLGVNEVKIVLTLEKTGSRNRTVTATVTSVVCLRN